MITGVDIVKAGIRIAAGLPMGFTQDEVGIHGWAIECRIYAEDPHRGFVPSPGEILAYRPPGGPGVRNDSGVYPGAKVSIYYDPMISKLVCWGRDRGEAIERMKRALREFVVKGIKTSIPFHRAVMEHPKFIEGHFDTTFIDAEMSGPDALGPGAGEQEREVALMLAAIAAMERDRERASRSRYGTASGSQTSAWRQAMRPRSGFGGR